MARLPRLNFAKIPQHVIQRGNNRSVCFFSNDDYSVYLDKLKEFSIKYKVAVHSYVLMTNHVHLLLTPSSDDGVSRLIQTLSSYYVTKVSWELSQRKVVTKNIFSYENHSHLEFQFYLPMVFNKYV